MINEIKFPTWFTALTGLFFISNLIIFGGATLFNPDRNVHHLYHYVGSGHHPAGHLWL